MVLLNLETVMKKYLAIAEANFEKRQVAVKFDDTTSIEGLTRATPNAGYRAMLAAFLK